MGTPNTGLEIEFLGSRVVATDEQGVETIINEEAQRLSSSTKSSIITTTATYSAMNCGGGCLTLSRFMQRVGDLNKIRMRMRVTYEGTPLDEVRHAELVRQISSAGYAMPEKRIAIPSDALLNAI